MKFKKTRIIMTKDDVIIGYMQSGKFSYINEYGSGYAMFEKVTSRKIEAKCYGLYFYLPALTSEEKTFLTQDESVFFFDIAIVENDAECNQEGYTIFESKEKVIWTGRDFTFEQQTGSMFAGKAWLIIESATISADLVTPKIIPGIMGEIK